MSRVQVGSGMSVSSFSLEERRAYVKMVNNTLAAVEKVKRHLPCDPETDELFDRMTDGIILCYLVNAAAPGTIFEKAIVTKDNLNVFEKGENIKLGINSAKSIGIKVVGLGTDTFREGAKQKILIMGILWQLIKAIVLRSITLKDCPQLVKILEEGEELGDLLKLNPEQLLIRWFNYHLKNAGQPKIGNLADDVKSGKNYTYLLNQISKGKQPLDGLEMEAPDRCNKVIDSAKAVGAETYITNEDIMSANPNLNLLFTASIFNACHGLDDLTPEEEEKIKKAGMIEDDGEGSREERSFRMWINSLNDGLHLGDDEESLKKWVNSHLKNAGAPEIKNFGDDVKDGKAYTQLLNQLNKDKCSLDPLQDDDATRMGKDIDNAKALGTVTNATPADLNSGDEKKNVDFVRALHDAMISGGDKRVIPGCPIQNLYEECKEALVLLQ